MRGNSGNDLGAGGTQEDQDAAVSIDGRRRTQSQTHFHPPGWTHQGDAGSNQISIETNDFATNPEPRCPRVLLFDVSGSMPDQTAKRLAQAEKDLSLR